MRTDARRVFLLRKTHPARKKVCFLTLYKVARVCFLTLYKVARVCEAHFFISYRTKRLLVLSTRRMDI